MAYDDEFDLDDEGLEGFDGDDAFGEMEDPFDTKDDRDPATKVAAGMMEKAVSLETAASVANTIADNALPEGFKVAKGATEDLVKEAQELYDKTQETLKGPTKRLKKVANRTIKGLDFLPDGIKNKLLSLTEVEEDGDGGYSQGNSDQAAIQASIGSIFGLMDQQNAQAKEQNEFEIDKEKVEKKRFETTSDYQSRIAKGVEQQTAYVLQVQSGYQRKMLELQHLQYFALRDNLVLQKGFTADAISNLRQITKNTGLPEFVKLRMSENYAQLTRERLMGKANETVSEYASKFIGKFKERAVGSIDGFVADISTGIEEFADMAETMQDMSEDMEGMGQDKWKLAGEMIAGSATGWAAKKFAVWLGERLEKNPEWARKNEWLLYNAENFPALISEWAQSDSGSDNFFIQQFKELIPTIGVDQENMISNLADKGTDISMFDEMTRRSIVEIIPGYLSRILKSTEDLRTGVDTDRVVYSADREEFTTVSKEVKNLRDRMFSESTASRALSNAMNVVDAIDPDGLLDKNVRRSLMKQIVDDARAGKTAFKLDDYINERKEFEGAEEVANFLRETVETTEEEGEYGETILKAKNSRKNLHLQRVISKEQRGLSDVFKNVQGELGKMNAYGTRDIGRSLGILGKNADGKDVVDFDRLRDLFFEQGETGDILDRYSDSLGDRLSEKEEEDEVDLDSMNIIQRKKHQIEEKRRKREEEKKKAKAEEEKKRKIVSGGSDSDYIPSRAMGSGHSTINANIDMSETNGYLRSLPDNLYEKFMNLYNDKRAVPVHLIGTDIDFSEMFKNGPVNNPSGPSGPSGDDHPLRSFLEEQLNLINAQLGTLNETAASSMHISMGDPSEFAEKMGMAIAKHTAAINSNWKRVGGLAKGTAQVGMGMMGTWYRFLGRSASTLFEKGSELAGIAGGKISKGYDWLTEKGAGLQVQGKDIIQRYKNRAVDLYVQGRTSPLLSKIKMEAGEYRDSVTGKVVKSIEDIKGAVLDAEGNIVATIEDLQKGLYTPDGELIKFKEVKNRIGGFVKGVGNTLGSAYNFQFNMIAKARDLLMDQVGKAKDFLSKPMDIYVRGSTTPRLLATVMQAGGYFSSATGKPIFSIKDIDGDVVDANGNVVLTLKEMADGIFDKYGVNISGGELASRLKNIATLGFRQGIKLMQWSKDLGMSVLKKGGEVGREAIDTIRGSKRFDQLQEAISSKMGSLQESLVSVKERASEFEFGTIAVPMFGRQTSILENIYRFMLAKWGEGVDYSEVPIPDGPSASYEAFSDTLSKGMSNVSDVVSSASKMASDKMEEIKDSATPIKDKVVEKVGSIKDAVSDIKKEDVIQNATTLKDAISSEASERADRTKAKIQAYREKASGVASSVVTSVELKAAGIEEWLRTEHPQAYARSMEGLLTTKEFLSLVKDKAIAAKDTLPDAEGLRDKISERADSISSTIKEKVGSIHNPFQANLGDKIARENEGPINSEVDPDRPRKATVKDLLASILKRTPTEEERKHSDSDGDGMRDGSWQSQRGGEKVETDEDGQPIIITQDGKEKPDFLSSALGFIGDKLTGAIGSLGSIISGALGLGEMGSDIIGGAADIADLGGRTRRGGKLARLGRGALKVGKGLGRVALGAGKLGLGVAKAGLGVAKFGLGAAKFLGTGALAAAKAFAIANPISAAVLGTAAVAYGGYKAYKYFSGRSAAKGVDELRFLQYGIDVSDKDALGLIRKLEEEVEDNIEWKDGQPVLTEGPAYFIEEFAEMFGVDMENQAEVEEWANWFSKRFIPIYMTYLSTANTMFETEDISDIEDDASEDQDKYKQYISMVAKPDGYGPEMGNPMDMPAPSIKGKEPYNGGREVLRQRLAELVPDAASKKDDPDNAGEAKKDKVTAEDVTAAKEKAIEDLTSNKEASVEVAKDNEPTAETKAIKDNVVHVDFNKAKGTAIDKHPETIDKATALPKDEVPFNEIVTAEEVAKVKKTAMEQATETTLSVRQSSPEPLSGNTQISNVVSIDTASIARNKLPVETVPDTYQDIDKPKPVEPRQTSKIVEAMDAPAPRVTGAKEEVPLSESYLKRVASASERSSQLDYVAAKQRERMIELLIAIKDDQRAYANFMLEKNGVETDKILSKPQSQASKASMPEVPKELAMPMDLGKKAM